MTETRDNDSELPPEEFGDGSGTLGPRDDTVNIDSDGRPLSGTLGPDDDTVNIDSCLLYTSPSPRDQRGSRMPSSA